MITRRAPRTLTRRRRPWRPFLDALEAYGVDPMTVPETTTLTHARGGIVVDVMATGPDGDLLFDEDEHGAVDIVTVRKFYPHPMRRTR